MIFPDNLLVSYAFWPPNALYGVGVACQQWKFSQNNVEKETDKISF